MGPLRNRMAARANKKQAETERQWLAEVYKEEVTTKDETGKGENDGETADDPVGCWLPMEQWSQLYEPKRRFRRIRRQIGKRVGMRAKDKILEKLRSVLALKMTQAVLDVTAKVLNRAEIEFKEKGQMQEKFAVEFVNNVSAVVLSYRFTDKRSKKMTEAKEQFFKMAAVEHLASCMDRMMKEDVELQQVDGEKANADTGPSSPSEPKSGRSIILARVQRKLRQKLEPDAIRPLAAEKIDEIIGNVEGRSEQMVENIKAKALGEMSSTAGGSEDGASGDDDPDVPKQNNLRSKIAEAVMRASESFDKDDRKGGEVLDSRLLTIGSVVLDSDEAHDILNKYGIQAPVLPFAMIEDTIHSRDDMVETIKIVMKQKFLQRLEEMAAWILFYVDQLFVMVTLAHAMKEGIKDDDNTVTLIHNRAEEINQNMEKVIGEEVSKFVDLIASFLDGKSSNTPPEGEQGDDEEGDDDDDDSDDDDIFLDLGE